MKKTKLVIPILVLLIGLPGALADNLVYHDDSWTYSDSTTSDGVVWGGYILNTFASGYASEADCLCWDWCDDGSDDDVGYSDWDTCWCKSTTKKNDCRTYSAWITTLDNEGKVSIDSDLGAFHSINTGASGDRWKCGVDLREYRDCDNSASQQNISNHEDQDGTPYYVIYPKKYDCNGEAYDTEGWFNSTYVAIWKQATSCGTYSRCDTNSAHNNHDDQQITSASQAIPSACSTRDGSTSVNYICSENNDCYSGNCGGSKTEKKYVCISDGGNNYNDSHRYWSNTCGGAGYANNWNVEAPLLSCTAQSGAGYVCDSDHDEQVVVEPSTPPSACRKNLDESCSVTTDCWNDDGGNWCNSISKCTDGVNGRNCGSDSDCTSGRCDSTCMAKLADGNSCDETSDCVNSNCISGYCGGPPVPYCKGSIEVLTEDSSGAPLSGLSVYWNATYNGTTDSLGQKIIGLNVTCSSDQNVTIKCSDNSTVCGTKFAQMDSTGDVDFLYFECTKCSSKEDLYITQSDIYVNVTSGKVNATVHSASITSNVQVTIYRQDEKGVTKESISTTISVTAGSEKNASFTLNSISPTDFLHIYVDSNDAVKEDDETNNYVFRAAVKQIKAYIDVKVDPSFSILNELIKEYITTFVEPASSSDADVVIIIGHPRVSNSEPFDINDVINCGGELTSKSYAGVVKSSSDFANSYSGKPEVLAYGNRIEGDVAAVKRLVNARSIFLDKGAYSRSYTSCVDDYDTLGISVMDLMHNNESQTYFRRNSSGFGSVVRKILFDNNFEVAVKPVKTLSTTSYGNSTILRVKNVNSDFSASYKDAVGISNSPVVFSGGLFSHLTAWEGNGKGLAKQMAGEGWDVWEIELTGGPDTDCSVSEVDTCPDYTYGDLATYYWPALIAGIQKYSGKGQVDYVGHSNGCRAALSALNNYSLLGKNNTGYYFDYNTGQYLFVNLSSNAVRRFVGVACPSVLDDTTAYTTLARLNSKFGSGTAGDVAMTKLAGKKHVTMWQYARYLVPETPTRLDDYASFLLAFIGGEKISYNLMDFYNDLAVSSTDTINLSGVNVSKLYLFATTPDDFIVPYQDQREINDSASALSATNKEIITYQGITFNHVTIKDQPVVKEKIKEKLK